MDLLDRRGRILRLVGAAAIGAAVGLIVVATFASTLDRDASWAREWFLLFGWSCTFVMVTIGTNALFAAAAKKRWRPPLPRACVVRRRLAQP